MAKKATGVGKAKAYGYDFKPVRKSVGGVSDSLIGGYRPSGIGGVKGMRSKARAKGIGGLTIGSQLR